jgi:hypothetical protein
MKGHRTRATKAGIAAAKEEGRRPERPPSTVEVSQLRAPNEIEQALYNLTTYLHRRDGHNQHFERCEHEHCIECRRVLGIKGYLHRFDDPALSEQQL